MVKDCINLSVLPVLIRARLAGFEVTGDRPKSKA